MARVSRADLPLYLGLAIAIAAGSAAIAGWNRGWAVADLHNVPTPTSNFKVNLGWWNATNTLTSDLFPGKLDLESTASRGLGVVTVIFISASLLLALYFVTVLAADVFDWNVKPMLLEDRQKVFLTGALGVAVLVASVTLYLKLAIDSRNELSDKFGDKANVWPRPDWASISAFVAGLSWLLVTLRLQNASRVPEGYLPM